MARCRRRRSVAALAFWFVASAATTLAALPTAADAARLSIDQGVITYRGDELELNAVTISRDGTDLKFAESSPAGISATFPCTGAGASASCAAGSATLLDIRLGEQNDSLAITGSLAIRVIAHGGDGVDHLTGGDDGEQLLGDLGDDILLGGGGDDRLDDGTEAQSAGADRLEGGPGDDQLDGGPVAEPGDVLAGGAGTDTADYSRRAAPLTVEIDEVANDGEAGERDNVWSDVEGVIGGSRGDVLIGNGAANKLVGGDGDDRLFGRDGDDTLAGQAGEDYMSGAGGPDVVTGEAGEDELDGGPGGDSLSGGGGSDTINGDEDGDMLAGGAGADALDGGDGDDRLDGGATGLVGADGDDKLKGGDGADQLLGADGDDLLDGGPGPDPINGGDGKDTATYEDRADDVFVTLDGLPNDGEANEGDNVATDVEVVLGGTLFNTLTGDANANTLTGGREEDFADGRGGADLLDGGSATDVLRARDGTKDTVLCGDGMDLAIVDKRDRTRDCEWVDDPTERKLTFGRRVLVRPETTFALRLPSAYREVPLADDVAIPVGSRINPQAGEVRLVTATLGSEARQRISVSGSPFLVDQQGRRDPSTVLRLAGRLRTTCSGNEDTRTRRSLRVHVTSPRASASGRGGASITKSKRTTVRAKGRYAIAAARDTEWEISDRCDGTFTRVLSGTVTVTDLGMDKTVTVRAGETYLASRRARSSRHVAGPWSDALFQDDPASRLGPFPTRERTVHQISTRPRAVRRSSEACPRPRSCCAALRWKSRSVSCRSVSPCDAAAAGCSARSRRVSATASSPTTSCRSPRASSRRRTGRTGSSSPTLAAPGSRSTPRTSTWTVRRCASS
jgi:Ca2+-binding RTX toxin-like protein